MKVGFFNSLVYILLIMLIILGMTPGMASAIKENPGDNENSVSNSGSSDTGDSVSDSGSSDTDTKDSNTGTGSSDSGSNNGDSDSGSNNGDSDSGSDDKNSDSGSNNGDSDSGSDDKNSDSDSDNGSSDSGSDDKNSDSDSDNGNSNPDSNNEDSDKGNSDSGSDDKNSDSDSDNGNSNPDSNNGDSDSGSDDGKSDSDSNDGSSTPGSDEGDSGKGDSNSGSGDSGTSPDNGNSGTKKSDTKKSDTKKSDTVKSDSGDSDTQDSDRTSSDTKSPDTKNSDSGNSDTEDEDSDSSSGSGMNLVSSEKATNIAVKELSTRSVMGGYPVRFEFIENVTCITKIEFDPKKTFRKTTTIVEELKNRSTLVPISPEGTVYEYVNIWVGDKGAGLPSSIRSGFVEFKVEKTWIKDNNISDARVILQRYDEEWQPLNTEKTGEDENYVYFKSETPGYSSFAITEYTGQTVKEVSGAGKIKETLRSLGSGGSLNGDTEKNSKIKNPMGAARIFMALSLPLFMLLIGYCILKKKI